MECPKCKSTQTFKNGYRRGKKSFRCRRCDRQFVLNPKNQPYPSEVKQLCINSVVGYAELNSASPTLKMYLNGMGLRGIERVTKIHHTTVINWIKDAKIKLPDAPEESEILEITEIDELQTFIGNKKNKIWL